MFIHLLLQSCFSLFVTMIVLTKCIDRDMNRVTRCSCLSRSLSGCTQFCPGGELSIIAADACHQRHTRKTAGTAPKYCRMYVSMIANRVSAAISFKHALFVFLFFCLILPIRQFVSPAPTLSVGTDLGAAPSQSKTDDDAAPNAGNWWETAEAIKVEYADRVEVRVHSIRSF